MLKDWLKKYWPYFGMALGFFIIAYYPTTEWMDAKRRQNVIEDAPDKSMEYI